MSIDPPVVPHALSALSLGRGFPINPSGYYKPIHASSVPLFDCIHPSCHSTYIYILSHQQNLPSNHPSRRHRFLNTVEINSRNTPSQRRPSAIASSTTLIKPYPDLHCTTLDLLLASTDLTITPSFVARTHTKNGQLFP
jgi:hypothetical protein